MLVKAVGESTERLHGHCGRRLGQRHNALRVVSSEAADRGGLLGAIDEGDAVAPLDLRQRDARNLHRFATRQPPAFSDPGAAQPDQR